MNKTFLLCLSVALFLLYQGEVSKSYASQEDRINVLTVMCNPQVVSWTVDGETCSANLTGGYQDFQTVSSTNGRIGSATFLCTNWKFIQQSGATCQPAGEGHCHGEQNPSKCQYIVPSYTIAPAVQISAGIRLNRDISNVLFNNYADTIGAVFVSNESTKDYFVPQATEAEFRSFLGASVEGLSIRNAVQPSTYVASPTFSCGIGDAVTPEHKEFSVPYVQDSGAKGTPIILSGYTKMTERESEHPSLIQTTVGSTTLSSPILFTHTNNSGASFTEAQEITFSGQGPAPHFTWNTINPTIASKLYDSSGVEVTGCTSSPSPTCASQSVSWTISGVTCTANLAKSPDGSTQTVTSTNSNTGAATYLCDNTTFIQQGTATCHNPPPCGCNKVAVGCMKPLCMVTNKSVSKTGVTNWWCVGKPGHTMQYSISVCGLRP